MVATRTGCFQPQHGDFGAETSASEKKCDTRGNTGLDSRVVHWFSRVNGGIVWLGERCKIALLPNSSKFCRALFALLPSSYPSFAR